MKIKNCVLVIALLINLAPCMTFERRAFAGERAGNPEEASFSRRIALAVGKSVEIELPTDASEVVVANPKLADAIVRTARRLYIVGVAAGQTTIFASDANGRQIAHLEVNVGRDVGELAQLLRLSLPRSDITARTVNETIILTGTVRSAGEASRAVDIANGFLQNSASLFGSSQQGKVVNALVI